MTANPPHEENFIVKYLDDIVTINWISNSYERSYQKEMNNLAENIIMLNFSKTKGSIVDFRT